MKPYIIALILVLGCLAFLAFNLGDLGLMKGDENYYFSSARRMITDGDWITPRYHHHIRFEKPVLYYWVVVLFLKLFGTSWAAARMTSVLFGTLTVLLTYLMGLRFFAKKPAFLSAIILATSFLFFQYARLTVIDITFLFLVTFSFYLFIKGDAEDKRSIIFLSSIPLGLSVMAKGPIGVAIFLMTVLIYVIRSKRYRALIGPQFIFGAFVVLLISLPWPYAMFKLHGREYLNHLWEIEAVDKVAGSMLNIGEIKALPLYIIKHLGYYIPVVIFSFAPWSLFLPFGIFKKLKVNKDNNRLFILSWFWTVFIFFSLVSFKHTHYMLLLSVPLAMIMANFFSGKRAANVIAVITMVVYLSLAGFIMPALDDGAMKAFSLKLASEITMDQEVGIASREFNLKKLGVHLNNLITMPYESSGDDFAQYKQRARADKLLPFLESDERVFCLITKKDYINTVPEDLRKRLYILETNPVWKKFKLKSALPVILEADWKSLKEEAYLISNRRQ
ncbi:MAG: glycosyltransferase family 39 protein [Candidatus Omnitrophica bacterium]|nr:glycosyltransferase family 39 protein [Candidatus Omnitrophota bacterium]